jgi:membrane protease YdiL (CAAX protease family)
MGLIVLGEFCYYAEIVEGIVGGEDLPAKLTLAFAATGLAPVLEEIVYRGVLLSSVAGNTSPPFAVISPPPPPTFFFMTSHARKFSHFL